MTYSDTLDYLYTQLPMYQRQGAAAMKKDLTNIRRLCAALGHPERRFPSVHLAGTNGKGTTAHLLAAALQRAGKRVGLYTSPHYKDFRERIKLDGRYVPEAFVVDFVARHRALFEEVRPSFFEITVAMAFRYFAAQGVEVAVIETGLGGRLDSTNVIVPLLSVITNISLDHQQFLGDTLGAIAGEKAGIIKPGVPVVIGERQPETTPVFEAHAAEKRAPLTYAEDHWRVALLDTDLQHSRYAVHYRQTRILERLQVELFGNFQAQNIRTALAVLRALEDTELDYTFLPQQLNAAWQNLRARTAYQGRWQLLERRPLVLTDSAHNEAGLRLAMQQLATVQRGRLHLVLGFVSDKKLDGVLPLLPPDADYYWTRPDIPRGLAAEVLREAAGPYGLRGRAFPTVAEALATARREADPNDTIYVGGSTFVVAEVL